MVFIMREITEGSNPSVIMQKHNRLFSRSEPWKAELFIMYTLIVIFFYTVLSEIFSKRISFNTSIFYYNNKCNLYNKKVKS